MGRKVVIEMDETRAPAALPPGFSFIAPKPDPMPTKLICLTTAYGDTLSGIAALFGTTAAEIARINGIANPDLIFPGRRLFLRVPASVPLAACESYAVKPGDTLPGIAERLGIPLEALVNANPQLIRAGQVLKLNGAASQ